MEKNIEKGQSLVEFSFTLVIILLMLSGAVDGGRALFTYMSLRDAAQEGALFGSLHPTETSNIQQRVINTSDMTQSMAGDLDVDVSLIGSACTGGGITIQVSYDNFQITMPFLGAVLGAQTVPISASVTDTILTPPCPSS